MVWPTSAGAQGSSQICSALSTALTLRSCEHAHWASHKPLLEWYPTVERLLRRVEPMDSAWAYGNGHARCAFTTVGYKYLENSCLQNPVGKGRQRRASKVTAPYRKASLLSSADSPARPVKPQSTPHRRSFQHATESIRCRQRALQPYTFVEQASQQMRHGSLDPATTTRRAVVPTHCMSRSWQWKCCTEAEDVVWETW